MNQLQVFNFNNAQVRTIEKEGQPWFVLKDVADVLEIGHVPALRQRLSDDVVSNYPIHDSLGRQQETTIINEDGLYDVILESRKPEARAFRKWITSEVLPTIRKTGSYTADKPKSQAELLLMYAQGFVEMEQRVERMESTVTAIQETFTKRDEDWRNQLNGMINGAAYRAGMSYRDLRNESYRLLEERGHCDLNARLRNLKTRLQDSGATKTQIDGANKMDVIESDPKLKEIYTNIVKELAIGSLSGR
ncbi:Bro-N domain-containing protein [Cohnella sp. AR92]|uniref:BRO-N domain-containing protein n=1 Tax=Cohnella sp. AR92 TaxID=648716 RepID=UPI001EDCFD5F|nr:Bro-N domain-containing protein [Cohnella sp. AR92]